MSSPHYFAASGNDANDCLSTGTACKTLARASSFIYPPGASILLNRGDTFAGTFRPKGKGVETTNWITLDAYGTGARPVISGVSNTINTGVEFDHVTDSSGWKIQNVDFHDQKIAGIDAEVSGVNKGLWIENVAMTNITGATVISSGFPTDGSALYPNAGYQVHYANGIVVWKVDDLTIKSYDITNSDAAAHINGSNNVTVDTVTSDHTYRAGWLFASIPKTQTFTPAVPNIWYYGQPAHYDTTNVTMSNFTLTWAGYRDGMWWGTTALQTNMVKTGSFGPGEIGFVQRPNASPDGVGFDLEGETTNIHFDSIFVHDCQGGGVLVFNHQWDAAADSQTGSQITNSTFTNNGLADTTNLPVFGRFNANNSNNVVVTGCVFNKSGHVGQSVNFWQAQTGGTPSGLTDTFPARFTTSGNTINP